MAATAGSRRIARLKAKTQAKSEACAAIAQPAVGYIRVSTEEQAAHGYGLNSQRKAVEAFAERQGSELVAMVEDPAVSGATKPSDRWVGSRMAVTAARAKSRAEARLPRARSSRSSDILR